MLRLSRGLPLRTTFTAAALSPLRRCATSAAAGGGSIPGIAPRKVRPTRPAVSGGGAPDAGASTTAASSSSSTTTMMPQADASFSTDAIAERLEKLAALNPAELEKLSKELGEQEEASSKALSDDGVHQMDVSLTPKYSGGLRVFWKQVSTYELPSSSSTTTTTASPAGSQTKAKWYGVALDGRKVKAFESTVPLSVPTEDFALAIAHEYATQKGMLNKLLMPLSDLASGAQHVSPQAIIPRIDYLMSFFRNDNLYFRSEPIAEKQDELIEPVKQYWERLMGYEVPRFVGLAHTHFPPHIYNQVRDTLIRMDMNPYQIVALCVVAQHTASLMLPMALFHGTIDLETALKINRMEEGHNLKESGVIHGFHDIREADIVVKIAASVVAWNATQDVSTAECARMMVTPGAS